MSGSIERTIESPDFLFALGAGRMGECDLASLANAVWQRRVRVLEAIRRQPSAIGIGVAELILASFKEIAKSGHGAHVLRDPFVGIWAEGVLRGERSAEEAGAVCRFISPQLEIEPALTFEVPTPGGALHLPRCGGTICGLSNDTASVRVALGQVEVESGHGRVSISPDLVETSGGLSWDPTREVEVQAMGTALRFELGSDDPAVATVGPSSPVSLDGGGLAKWEAVLGQAWELILTRHRASAAAVAAAATVIVPQSAPNPERHVSSSNSDGFGVVGLSFTEDIPTLAVGLIHEARHALLSAALTVADLHDGDDTARFYAGWRDDPRPVGALLQGACAFSAVTAFWRVEHELAKGVDTRRRAALELVRWWTLTSDALARLRASGLLSALGARFVDGLDQLLGSEPTVEPLVAMAASDFIAEHRTKWLANWRAQPRQGHQEFDLTTLPEAWHVRLFPSAHSTAQIDPVDRALTLDDRVAAADLAASAFLAEPDSSRAAFRFARALHRVGRTDVARRITSLLEAGLLASISPALGGLVPDQVVGWSATADFVDATMTSGGRALASDTQEQCLC